ncbi:MAG: TetR/AcrR family transcriptional regulator [Acidimicrobiia bacterium]|nr:TetR/AcrR family transcriptional regulator [Acidimicrobiia bacterium]
MTASSSRALPRGPHGLSREEVAHSQRTRLLTAMTEAVAEKGYANTVVADVVSRSGVSRATFYKMFADKEACFLAAFDMNAELVARVMETGLTELHHDSDIEPIDRLDRVLELYLTALASAPALARVFLVEVYAAGPAAIARRRATQDRFVDIVAATYAGRPGMLGTRESQRFAAEFVVGAVSSMVTNIVGAGDTDALPALRVKLMKLARQFLET